VPPAQTPPPQLPVEGNYYYPTVQQPMVPRNGLGISSFVLGLVATLLALVPFGIIISAPAAIVGIALGLSNLPRLRKHIADNTVMTWFGIVLSALGIVLAIVAVAALYHGLTTTGN
jgi:uncharacterized membrane protein